ncbi:G-box-binding factor 4-like [Canna indica]|uniref:G-box-binding factor 4-like n=1 Tax=Canna indica TaxID=4628 RepID=A0AAQ3QJZ2_9LILI|nr:G-box-binding factor 4-like [Canna indica]
MMASSRVMPSSSSAANSDRARPPPSIYPVAAASEPRPPDSATAHVPAGSANMDDLIRAFYVEAEAQVPPPLPSRDGGGGKTTEVVWKEIATAAAGRGAAGGNVPAAAAAYGEMTLEDFLARAGTVRGEDVRVPSSGPVPTGFGMDPVMADRFVQQEQQLMVENPVLGFGNGVEGSSGSTGGGGGRSWKRTMADSVDKAALQRQKRMIKNRESAARSRERKQAYTVELESLVMRLEEENANLLREQEEDHKMRLQQLMKNLIPVTEMKKPPPGLIDDSAFSCELKVFKHKKFQNLYLFQNRRAFDLCNFDHSTLLYDGKSSHFAWRPSRPGYYYLATRNPSQKSCENGEKVPVRVITPDPSSGFPSFPAPAPTSGADISSSPSKAWTSSSPNPSPGPAPVDFGPLQPKERLTPANAPSAETAGSVPFISSSPAVPLPVGETDTATILPFPTPGSESQVVGMASSCVAVGMSRMMAVMMLLFGLVVG